MPAHIIQLLWGSLIGSALYTAVYLVILFATCLHTVALRDLCAVFLITAVNVFGIQTLELLRYAHLQNILSLILPDR